MSLTYLDLLPLLPARITEKFDVDLDSGCWIWTGARQQGGYGVLKWLGSGQPAHRVIYKLLVGPISDGLDIDHACGVPACVSPDHLRPLPVSVNRAQKRPRKQPV